LPKKKEIIGSVNESKDAVKVYTKSTGEVHINLTTSNPKTTSNILAALPFESKVQTWGDEIYFKIPVKVPEENVKTVVEIGDVAYWPPGESMCIFFGPTPASKASEPRAYSPVNVFGKITGDPFVFKKVKNGEKIKAERR
jgi:hypothetical protein